MTRDGVELCDGDGACLAGVPPTIDDGNSCTADSCDALSGVIHTPLLAGTSCANEDACDGAELCDGAGACLAGVPPTIDDGNPCTADSCDSLAGVIHAPLLAGTSCGNGDVCDGGELCDGAGACLAGVPPTIDDGNPCTADSCDSLTGVRHEPIIACGGLPPDPSTVAPALNLTVATDFHASIEFLYSGANPIQTGVAADTIVPSRAAVLRGRVHDQDDLPLPGVSISVLGHPELGGTLSRVDGMFDLVVNGGGPLTIVYQREGRLPAHRQVVAPWRDFAWLPDVVLVTLDPNVTTVDFVAGELQVARGSVNTDDNGTRQETILFRPGTRAIMELGGGDELELLSGSVRATEYTVGPLGPQAMPAALPPASAYTHAVELSIDEALAAEADRVRFDPPVVVYVDNFLASPVGIGIPLGEYDRAKGQWIGHRTGRSLMIVGFDAQGRAEVDLDGSGIAADGVTLASVGIDEGERRTLATIYGVGASLWRFEVPHFSPWDANLGWAPQVAPSVPAQSPNQPSPTNISEPRPDAQCFPNACTIDIHNQVLGERVDIVGTPLSLSYSSDRVVGRQPGLEIPLTSATLPDDLHRVNVTIRVGGQFHQQAFDPTPDLTTSFAWDGLDVYGRRMQGSSMATIETEYVYPSVRYVPPTPEEWNAFAVFPTWLTQIVDWLRVNTKFELRSKQLQSVRLRHWDGVELFAGWSLSVHHVYDPTEQMIYLGNGGFQRPRGISNVVVSGVVGNGATTGALGDGGSALDAELGTPLGLAFDGDGTLFIADAAHHRIRKVGTDGIITTFAGTGVGGYGGDGGPADQALLDSPSDIAIGADGAVYIADTGNHRIRKVTPSGIETVAGSGFCGFSGDGGPAAFAELCGPRSIATGLDGSLFVADSDNHVVRHITPNGFIRRIAGIPGVSGFAGEDEFAFEAPLDFPTSLAVGADGSVYIVEPYSGSLRLRHEHELADHLQNHDREHDRGVGRRLRQRGWRSEPGDLREDHGYSGPGRRPDRRRVLWGRRKGEESRVVHARLLDREPIAPVERRNRSVRVRSARPPPSDG
ncbi:MAG: hypothetical protein HY791_00025 [Deltaproteobacteria bacterium]|nr:hypothetical protein [Deltaproteobacteria bacterium]